MSDATFLASPLTKAKIHDILNSVSTFLNNILRKKRRGHDGFASSCLFVSRCIPSNLG